MTVIISVPSHGRSSDNVTVTGENGDSIQGSQVVAVGTPLPTASMPLGVQQGSVMVYKSHLFSQVFNSPMQFPRGDKALMAFLDWGLMNRQILRPCFPLYRSGCSVLQ